MAGLLWAALAAGALWLGPGALATAGGIKLTDESARAATRGHSIQISPDGTRVVFTADSAAGDRAALYSVPITGGPMVQLHGGTGVPGNYKYGETGYDGIPAWLCRQVFQITPDGESVVYGAEPSIGSVDLYKAPIAGGPSVQLASLSLHNFNTLRFSVAPDGAHVVYRMEESAPSADTPGSITVYSVPAAGGEPPVTLFDGLVWQGNSYFDRTGFPISPDSSRAIFAHDGALYVADLGGGPVTTLASVGPDHISDAWYTPDGSRILFGTRAPPNSGSREALYSVGVAGGTPVLLVSQSIGLGYDPKGGPNGYVTTIGGTDVITAHTSAGVTEFRRVAIDTGASTLMGTVTTGTDRWLQKRAFLHDATGTVYLGVDDVDTTSLWYISFSGGEPVRLMDDTPDAGSYRQYVRPDDIRCWITPDDQTLVYSVPTTDGRELYSVALAGAASVRLDHDPPAGMRIEGYQLMPDGQYAIYSVCQDDVDGSGSGRVALYAVDVHGGTPWLLTDPPAPGRFIVPGTFAYEQGTNVDAIAPDGTVLYWVGNDDTGYDLYASAVPEPATLGLLALAGMTLVGRRRNAAAR